MVGPYTKSDARLIADGRSAPARRYRRYVKELTDDHGGVLVVGQRLLIERTAMLLTRLYYLDNLVLRGRFWGIFSSGHYGTADAVKGCTGARNPYPARL
ncbi:hypothetical protein Gxy13693_119_004 [Komagataeibacter xylinus NBRC 13693]|uniref:Uncharacterized protein n=1 Tax=Komagataeibacter xylinus NBRC 13693 TaxID=1234668 RepID=A0A0D6QDM9_KOMXY|nr:hypothetical protein Gxy13693_119_004 [Komagataeibacter xylinus NBRC 13693]